MIWFTSDLHLGHRNIAGEKVSNWKDGYRDFDQANQMDNQLLLELNTLVAVDDTLYFLGDFCLSKGRSDIQNYRDRIVCKNIVFLLGNHDKSKNIIPIFGDINVHNYLEVEIDGIKYCLMHYAMRIWNKAHKTPGSIHLYGHSHSKLEDTPWGRSMDVGVDNAHRLFGEYRPFSLVEIVDIMSKRTPKLIDHHGTSEDKQGKERIN